MERAIRIGELVSVAMSLVAGLALADGIESANTVGYITHEMDFDIGVDNIGLCLSPVGGGDFTVVNKGFGTAFNTDDALYIFNGDEWDFDIYSYIGEGEGWLFLGADSSEDVVESFTVPAGANVYYAGANETITVAGEVAPSGKATVTFDPEENWIFYFTNPFPIATTFGDLETFANVDDAFYRFNPSEWDFDIYSYIGEGEGWLFLGADGSEDNITDPATVFLDVGQGASYVPANTDSPTVWEVTLNY